MSNDNTNSSQKKPRSSEQHLISLGQILQRLREEEDVDIVIKTTIKYFQEKFDYQLIWIALYDETSRILYGRGGVTPDGDTTVLKQSLVIKPGNFLERVITELSPLGIANLKGEVRALEWQQIGNKYNIQGTILLPIRYKQQCLGLVLLGSERWGYLLSSEIRSKLLILVGELGLILYKENINHEYRYQRRETESPTKSLLELLEVVRTAENLDKRLEAVVLDTHKFISPNRTNIYWLQREGNYFWCRMNNSLVIINSLDSNQLGSVGIKVQELNELYYSLATNQMVCITQNNHSVQGKINTQLLKRLGISTLLAAPIIWQKDLLGFLSVESNHARTWTELEKQFLQGAAGLISLAAPNEMIEGTIKQLQQDNKLTNQVAQGIYKEEDLDSVLQICAGRILERLTANRFLLLRYNPDTNSYQVIFQSMRQNRRLSTFMLPELAEVDLRLLQNARYSLEIENVQSDLRLFNWRKNLMDNGVKSLLISNCIQGQIPELLILITQENIRSWPGSDKELLWVFSQNLGVVINYWQIKNNTKDQQKISHLFKKFLDLLIENKDDILSTELAAIKQINSILECPLALTLSWKSEETWANIVPGVMESHKFSVVQDIPIPVQRDVFIELALAHNSYLILKGYDLPSETRQWLIVPDKSKILIMALRANSNLPCTGIIILADYEDRVWTAPSLNTTVTLITQFSWWKYQQERIYSLESSNEKLCHLNWYKHRRLEEVYRMSTSVISKIRDLGIPANELTQMRYKLLFKQLDYITTSMAVMIKQEQWEFHLSSENMTISSLLKRAVDKVDNFVKEQQLWIGVHGVGQSPDHREVSAISTLSTEKINTTPNSDLSTTGDIIKIELIFHELLVAACQRSPIGERVDIWCRSIDDRYLELSITDNGVIAPEILVEINQPYNNLLFSKSKNERTGLHLVICKNMIQQLGGELHLYQLPDKRFVSRLILPFVFQGSELKPEEDFGI